MDKKRKGIRTWEENRVLNVYIEYADGSYEREYFDKKTGSYDFIAVDENGDVLEGFGGHIPTNVWHLLKGEMDLRIN